MSVKTHHLKILPEYYRAVKDGTKKFELRYDDREFQTGDEIVLEEWDETGYYGNSLHCKIDYILKDHVGLDPDYVILSITVVN